MTVEALMTCARMTMNSKILHVPLSSRSGTKKGRGDKISAQPVRKVNISKTKLDETRSREGVKCLLYEARANPEHDV